MGGSLWEASDFQDGRLEGVLSYESVGALDLTTPILLGDTLYFGALPRIGVQATAMIAQLTKPDRLAALDHSPDPWRHLIDEVARERARLLG